MRQMQSSHFAKLLGSFFSFGHEFYVFLKVIRRSASSPFFVPNVILGHADCVFTLLTASYCSKDGVLAVSLAGQCAAAEGLAPPRPHARIAWPSSSTPPRSAPLGSTNARMAVLDESQHPLSTRSSRRVGHEGRPGGARMNAAMANAAASRRGRTASAAGRLRPSRISVPIPISSHGIACFPQLPTVICRP